MNIIIIGDVMLDINYNSEVKRNAPEADIPIYNILGINYILGGASNIAVNLKNLGIDVELLSVIGDDLYANKIEEILKAKQINYQFFVDKERKTTQKNRIFYNDELKCRFDVENTHDIPLTIQDEILNHIEKQINLNY
jgi:D-beta-D-heptose 7-phosphate kinase/D-beta-D-heptose 1-phosphate adenosyltransferase